VLQPDRRFECGGWQSTLLNNILKDLSDAEGFPAAGFGDCVVQMKDVDPIAAAPKPSYLQGTLPRHRHYVQTPRSAAGPLLPTIALEALRSVGRDRDSFPIGRCRTGPLCQSN
jgi:hypothetical protein